MRLHIVITALLFNIVNAAIAQESSKSPASLHKTLSSENGRFVFGQISEFRRDQYMLDTKTGRLWQKAVTKVGKPGEETEVTVLEPILYEAPDGKWGVDPK